MARLESGLQAPCDFKENTQKACDSLGSPSEETLFGLGREGNGIY